jgi:4-amino-4-deoxy-L-arabinose transferase-like glycosyltransferase
MTSTMSPARRVVGRGWRSRRWWAVAALLVFFALAIRVAWVAHTPHYLSKSRGYDSLAYSRLGRRIASGNGWSRATYHHQPSAFRAPMYPLFLAPLYRIAAKAQIYPGRTLVRYAQALLGTLTVILTALLALALWGRGAAIAALAIGSVYLPLILVGGALLSEVLFVPLLLGAVLCALAARRGGDWKWVVAAGVLIGLAALTRQQGLIVAPLIAWIARPTPVAGRGLKVPGVVLVCAALTVVPWTIRNLVVTGDFIPVSTEVGPTLAGTYNQDAAAHTWRWRPLRWNPDPRYQAIRRRVATTSQGDYDQQMRWAVVRHLVAHPTDLPAGMFWNSVRMLDLQGLGISRFTAYTSADASPRQADGAVFCFWIVGLLALVGGIAAVRRSSVRLVWAIPLVLLVTTVIVTSGTPRQRAALDPFVICLAAFTLNAAAERLRGRFTEPRPAAA